MKTHQRCSRRSFLKTIGKTALAAPLLLNGPRLAAADAYVPRASEAMYYEKLAGKKVHCRLCPNQCKVADGERGECGVRENRSGVFYTLVYGQPCAVHVDPIEKKPLFHYFPGAQAFSLATAGCNFNCRFCQNWEISQRRPEEVQAINLPPEAVVRQARSQACPIIAYTYSEPVIFFEYMRDIAALGKEKGIPSVMISNGFIEKKPLQELCRSLGAVKVDLKAFTEDFYREQCGGELQPVLDTLLALRDEKIWFEVVVLLIPGLNDDRAEIERMCRWIVQELGAEVPLHFSRFTPMYMLKNIPPTPAETLYMARKIAQGAGIKFCYVGNLLSDAGNTYCPSCGRLLIRRLLYSIENTGLAGNRCRYCKTVIPGVFS
ncbi:MAG: AmmeMemoRadiSam system radical SAM enzyme [Candidatus Aminicenantes bacterium]|nr:AmmeMemoRadiSam system radical SAM enzyme [Candidatus Aminicenantes bacterium]